MTYIDLINSFWDLAATNPLSTGQVSLYFALMHVCNRSYWTEWFPAPNQVLSVLTGLSRSGIQKARNELKQRGLIDFRERGTRATSYKLVMADSVQTDVLMSDSVQAGVQNGVQKGNQNGAQDGVQNGGTLYKTKDLRQDKDSNSPPHPPMERFGEFLSAYPKDCGHRYLTENAYAGLLASGKVTEDGLVKCARNYAEACRIEGTPEKYMKNAENFLNDFVFEKYLPGRYRKPVPEKPGNGFGDFPRREYDFGQLEREILDN